MQKEKAMHRNNLMIPLPPLTVLLVKCLFRL